jgi:16S rRNA (guanine966-N2)-methyltransferase
VRGDTTRPTADRVKESLFNIIAAYIPDAEVLDLFAGTGNLGIEALSRGARSAVFVDKSRECMQVIQENLEHTKFFEAGTIIVDEAANALVRLSTGGRKFDVIFLDPPYKKNFIQEALDFMAKNDIIRDDGVIVAERDADDVLPEDVGRLHKARDQRYGDTVLSFYKVKED